MLLGMLLNSLAITLMIKADFGISAISAVPYVLSVAFPQLSLGTWNTLLQLGWLVFTMLAIRRFKPGYLFSFLLAFLFGLLLDGWGALIRPLELSLPLRFVSFAIGFGLMALGIAAFFVCGTPVLPFDTVPRAFSMEKGWSARKARTSYDLFNLALAISFGLLFKGRLVGIGWVTVFNALTMGYASGYVINHLRRHYDIAPHFVLLGKWV